MVLTYCTGNAYIFSNDTLSSKKEVGISGQKTYFWWFLPIKTLYFTDSASQVNDQVVMSGYLKTLAGSALWVFINAQVFLMGGHW